MARVVVAASASLDQAAILSDLHVRAGLSVAVRFRMAFRHLYDRLGEHPAIGPTRPTLGPDIRIGIVSPYIVIYRFREEEQIVTVLRVVHGRRRITGALLRDLPG